jgi:excisionase family DNA binding protein
MTTEHNASPKSPRRRPLLGYREAAQLLGVPRGTLYAWVSEGRIPHIRFSGRMVRFDPDEIEAWIDAQRVSLQGSGFLGDDE